MAVLIRSMSLFCLLLALAACGGGGGGGGDDAVDRPQARASADTLEVNAGEGTVQLDGGASTSPNGDIITWEWRFLSRPEGSEATLNGADTDQASFTPDLPGTYVIRLVVNDGTAGSGDTSASRVTITALNPNPLAVVPDEINWILGTVQLDGSRSLPPDGGDASQLVYDWTLTRKPEGSAAELDDGSQIYPRFTADEVGLYQARLVVRYGDKVSQPDTVDINIVEANAIPVARIQAPTDVTRGDTVELDGSGSEDADGDSLQYRWRFIQSLPRGSNAQLSSTTSAQTRFVADSAYGTGRYNVELCVFDGVSRNCTSSRIEAAPADGQANTAPVAVINPGNGATFEAERGAEVTVSSGAYDVDGDALAHTWEMVAHPSGYDPDGANGLEPGSYCSATYCPATFTPTVDGNYRVRLTVSDGEADASTEATFTARLGANRAPSARAAIAGGTPTTLVGNPITLDGEGSSDPDDNRLSYQWTLVQRPDNSQTQLQRANTAFPALTPDRAGAYVVALMVTDEHGATSNYVPGNSLYEVTVLAKTENNAPITRIYKATAGIADYENHANPGPQHPHYDAAQPFVITNQWLEGDRNEFRADQFKLEADSTDPDGDTLSHLWTLVSAPAGNRMQVNGSSGMDGVFGDNTCVEAWTPVSEETWQAFRERIEAYTEWPCSKPALSPTEPGVYVFEYQVYDGSEFAGPFTATVHAVERANYPTLLMEVPSKNLAAEPSSVDVQTFFSAYHRQCVWCLARLPLERSGNRSATFPVHRLRR
ncbi:PKD domain-containing protein [Alcanivorax marinus]|uniref:PKD domain-containing protein n=1 Tax=Alloalcanivorax marinus TaxID=1177169 RepID=A0A9Q3UJB6_9GAMM|nr:PKD domain-containing protein [Alloalcanivorax marinus]MCC4308241.1 PKD domain-containing protein [Alloalcanivorax marinus]